MWVQAETRNVVQELRRGTDVEFKSRNAHRATGKRKEIKCTVRASLTVKSDRLKGKALRSPSADALYGEEKGRAHTCVHPSTPPPSSPALLATRTNVHT